MYLKHFAKYSLLFSIAAFLSISLYWPFAFNTAIIFGIPINNLLTFLSSLPFVFLFAVIFFNQATDTIKYPILTGLIILTITEALSIFWAGFFMLNVIMLMILYLVVTAIALFLKRKKERTRSSDANISTQSHNTFYYPVSIVKLCLMYLITFGWYKFYWWYKNWRYVKLREKNKSMPLLRCIFPIFFYDRFLEDVNKTSRANNSEEIKHTELLTDYYIFIFVGFIAISFLTHIYNSLILHTSRHLITNMLSVIFLIVAIGIFIPPQLAINKLNRSTNHVIDKKIKNIDALLIIFGLFIWLSACTLWTLNYRSDTRNAEVFYNQGLYGLAFNKALTAAELGDAEGQYLVGKMYLLGKGTEQNSEEGIEYLERAAEQGHLDAQYILGSFYHEGTSSIKKDDQKSAAWYQKAVAGGHIFAANNLGVLYDHGWGVKKDPEKAMALFRQAAAKGDSSAMYNVGLAYSRSNAIEDHKSAASWFDKSIKTEPNPCALNDLAILYTKGKGVPQDPKKAKKLFKDAGYRLLWENGDEIFDDNASMTKTKLDESITAFVDYQYHHYHTNEPKTLGKGHSPEAIANAKKISQKLVHLCWE